MVIVECEFVKVASCSSLFLFNVAFGLDLGLALAIDGLGFFEDANKAFALLMRRLARNNG